MTEHEMATIAVCMMDRYLDRHWQLRFEDSIPVRGQPGRDLAGHTSWDQRIIRLSRRYAGDWGTAQLWQVMTHEIAHALTPEDWTHGDVFQAKWKEIRND